MLGNVKDEDVGEAVGCKREKVMRGVDAVGLSDGVKEARRKSNTEPS